MENVEPIHDVCDNVIGPLDNGVSSDLSFAIFGLSHPIATPWHKLIKFPIHQRSKMKENPKKERKNRKKREKKTRKTSAKIKRNN